MRHWLQLATRNWRVKPGRTAAAVVAIALGVGTVVSITCFYESVRRSIHERVVGRWLGKSHLSIEPPLGHWGKLDESLAAQVSALDNIAAVNGRLMRRMYWIERSALSRIGERAGLVTPPSEEVDAIGIDPRTEYLFHEYEDLAGRRIRPNDKNVALIETGSASKSRLRLGDTISLATGPGGPEETFTIIGWFHSRRIAKFQRPNIIVPLSDLQRLKNEPGQLTVIDVMLHDHSAEAVRRAADVVKERLAALGQNVQVTSAAARLEQLQEAERITQLVLALVAFVAMLTAFFIILTTMSMGIVERIGQLGMMRCVGVTRAQLGVLVMLEVLPMGLVGIVLGLPVGIAMTRIGAALVPEYVQGLAISRWGIGLAVAGGALTTGLSAALLVFQVGRVSPLVAANPEARPTRWRVTAAAGLVGVLLILLHDAMVDRVPAAAWFKPSISFVTIASIYGGYVLLAPAFVVLVGSAIIAGVAPLFRLRSRLARDQISRAPWRSAGVCWMLMVGLSLIVYITARGESIIAAWDFPKKIPGSFVWSPYQVPASTRHAVARLDGVGEYTVVTEFPCLAGRGEKLASGVETIVGDGDYLRDCTFVAGELDKFLSMTKISFIEGNYDDAIEKLRRGGALLLPPEAAHILGLSVGDTLDIAVGARRATFEIAGVVQSPALDIAVTYFQADSYMMRAASASVLGTLDDIERLFGIKTIGMYVLNIKLPPAPRPPLFDADAPPEITFESLSRLVLDLRDALPNERSVLPKVVPQIEARLNDRSAPLDELARQTLRRFQMVVAELQPSWDKLTPQNRWDTFREQLVLRKVAFTIGREGAVVGSIRKLKQQIDRDIRDMTLIMSAMPAVAVAVAALGVANLMMVGVSARTRQIAVLRAVGATKSQIVRLVFAEAVTLGILGCVAGITLGMHTSRSASVITQQILGMPFPVVFPWHQAALGAALTIVVCVLAGIAPARRAARNNVVDALHAG